VDRCDVHAVGHLIWLSPDAEAMHHRRVEFLRRQLGGHTALNQSPHL
jgi:hypothetical protein